MNTFHLMTRNNDSHVIGGGQRATYEKDGWALAKTHSAQTIAEARLALLPSVADMASKPSKESPSAMFRFLNGLLLTCACLVALILIVKGKATLDYIAAVSTLIGGLFIFSGGRLLAQIADKVLS